MVKILITGSSGMLGTELCKALGVDNEIIGLDIVDVKNQDSKLKTFHKADITDSNSIKEIFDNEKPNLVIHAAAWTDVDGCEESPDKAYAINVLGTENIVRAIGKQNIPVMLISTDFVFNGKRKEPYVETDIAHPINVYGKTKREAENIMMEGAHLYVIVRTSWLYGKNGKNFVDTIISKSKFEERLKVVNDQIGSPTYVKDLARALKDLIKVSDVFNRQIYHITNSGECSWYDFAVKILAELKVSRDVILEPISSLELSRSAVRPSFSVLDNGKFKKTIGYKLRSWQEALSDYMEV